MKYCSRCGTGLDDSMYFCTNCGANLSQAQDGAQMRPKTSSGKETASLVCGILSFFVAGIVLGILAIVFAHQAKKENGGILSSTAKAGLICGIIGLVLAVISLFLVLSLSSLVSLAAYSCVC